MGVTVGDSETGLWVKGSLVCLWSSERLSVRNVISKRGRFDNWWRDFLFGFVCNEGVGVFFLRVTMMNDYEMVLCMFWCCGNELLCWVQ